MSKQVRLTYDLTDYLKGLTVGTAGQTNRYGGGMWSRSNDCFTSVTFPQGTLDVLWRSLEVGVDDNVPLISMTSKEWKRESKKALATATDISCQLGPRGGWYGLDLTYTIRDQQVKRHFPDRFEGEAVIARLHRLKLASDIDGLDKEDIRDIVKEDKRRRRAQRKENALRKQMMPRAIELAEEFLKLDTSERKRRMDALLDAPGDESSLRGYIIDHWRKTDTTPDEFRPRTGSGVILR